MFGGRAKKSECPIGLDVGGSGVHLLQLSVRDGAAVATAAAFEPLSADLKTIDGKYFDLVASAIKSAWDRGRFSGNRVVAMLPASAMQCKNLRLPMMPADELTSAVQWEAADRFRMGEGQCSVQHLHAGHVNQGDDVRQELILLAAQRKFVEKYTAMLVGCGLRPVAIDSIPTALSRLTQCTADAADHDATKVVIDMGQNVTKVLIAVDGQVRFYKPIDLGGAQFDSVLSGALSMTLSEARSLRRELALTPADHAEPGGGVDAAMRGKAIDALRPSLGELGREIGLCLRYYGVTFRGSRPAGGLLVGGGATAWMAEALGTSSGLTLSVDGALGTMDLSGVREVVRPGHEGAWAVAAGLSMRNHMEALTAHHAAERPQEDSVFDGEPNSTQREAA